MMPQSMLIICLVFGICVRSFDSAGGSAGAAPEHPRHCSIKSRVADLRKVRADNKVTFSEVDQKRT